MDARFLGITWLNVAKNLTSWLSKVFSSSFTVLMRSRSELSITMITACSSLWQSS
jgi:hypothetical protein